MKKTYEPTRSDIQTLYKIQSLEDEIQRIRKERTQVRIGLTISGTIAVIVNIAYFKEELSSWLTVPFIFFLIFYFAMRKEQSSLGQKIKYQYEVCERVNCHYAIENGKVYVIQKDFKKIEINQYR
jgi:hypothetical protein